MDGDDFYDKKDLLDNLIMFKTASQNNENEMLDSWHQKAHLLFELDLDSMVLDVSGAYS